MDLLSNMAILGIHVSFQGCKFKVSGQITIIPSPELRACWRYSHYYNHYIGDEKPAGPRYANLHLDPGRAPQQNFLANPLKKLKTPFS